MELSEIIGKRIKSKREDLGVKQNELAERVGVSPSAINQFEKGEKKPSPDVLTKIAEELGVSTDYLLGASEEEKLFVNETIAAAFRDFKNLSAADRKIILSNIEFLKSKAKRKEK
jgi:transcriptional regulator with XRE-family HTH domain